MRVLPRQVHIAGRNLEVTMNEVHKPVREIPGKVGAVVSGAVFLQTPRHVDTRITLGGQFDIGVRLVIAQQDVETRLPLLDQVVLERQRFLLVIDLELIDRAGVGDQRAGLGVGQTFIVKVTAHPSAQVLGLAVVNNRALGVLGEVHPGQRGKLARHFEKIVEGSYT